MTDRLCSCGTPLSKGIRGVPVVDREHGFGAMEEWVDETPFTPIRCPRCDALMVQKGRTARRLVEGG